MKRPQTKFHTDTTSQKSLIEGYVTPHVESRR